VKQNGQSASAHPQSCHSRSNSDGAKAPAHFSEGFAEAMFQDTRIPRRKKKTLFLLISVTLVAFAVATEVLWNGPAHAQIAVQNQGYLPFSDAPIFYRTAPVNDPVAKLQKQIDRGEATLIYEPQFGYLKSLLEKLAIPVSSQTLVFSKTSFQYKKISPQTPRALYFNDDVYVGFVHDGKALEIISFDPMQGAIFYLLDVQQTQRPQFQRAELDCTQCHIVPATKSVPGVLLRSIFPTPSGTQVLRSPSFITGHDSPLKDRWGGWYVTGTNGNQTHMGNAVVPDGQPAEQLNRTGAETVVDLSKRFDASNYLSGQSDIVAHLVLAHQTQLHNLITLTNYKTRLALYAEAAKNKSAGLPEDTISDAVREKYQRPAEELLRYLLFTNEASLQAEIKGTSGFAEEFASRGPRDARGRSLRDFDLRTRIFKHPCSYLIYSDDFDALPSPAKEYVYHRLFEVLTGRDQSSDFAKLTKEDRQEVLEILLATKKNLPDEWRQYGLQAQAANKDPGRSRPEQSDQLK
jgi:hypothetical protein